MTEEQHAGTLSDWVSMNIGADGTSTLNTTRAMGLVPVNAPQATSVVGHTPEFDSEFVISRIASHKDKTSGGQQVTDHRGNNKS